MEKIVFHEEVKMDIDSELDWTIAKTRLVCQIIPVDADIHPDRISFA